MTEKYKISSHKEDTVHILLSHKKEWNNAIWIIGPRDYYAKWIKSDKDKYHDITYLWNLKYGTNEHIYSSGTDSQTLRTKW